MEKMSSLSWLSQPKKTNAWRDMVMKIATKKNQLPNWGRPKPEHNLGKRKEVNVLIGTPCTHNWEALFGQAMLAMVAYVFTTPLKEYHINIGWDFQIGSMIWKAREDICQHAVENGFSHVLFLDSDQTFPPDTLHKLLERDVDVVACNVAIKTTPTSPTARRLDKDNYIHPVFTSKESTGLEEVWRVGTGVMMFKTEVLKKLERPWFTIDWDKRNGHHGEDWMFCARLEDAGIPLYVDHDLSWLIGHVGQVEYGHHMMQSPEQLKYDPIKRV